MEFFTSETITENMTVIQACTGEYVYLIQGSREAVLIDCSVGIGHLRKYVEKITDKPITVLLTHGHVDHASGAAEFEKVYMNYRDLQLYRAHSQMKERIGYIKSCLGNKLNELKETDIVPSMPEKKLFNLEDGMCFDLGELHIQAMEFPGHTQGEMIFLLEEPRILILGDACNNTTFVFFEESCTIEKYRNTLKNIRYRLNGKFDRIFISHHTPEVPVETMENVLEVCDEILAGTADDQPYSFRGEAVWYAKANDVNHRRLDGKCGNVVYKKDKVR